MKTFEEFKKIFGLKTPPDALLKAFYEAYKLGWNDCADAHIRAFVEDFKQKNFSEERQNETNNREFQRN